MDPRARATYRALAWAFLAVAAGVVAIDVGERIFGFEFFNGSPVPTALFLGGIGGLLLWTARGRGDDPPPAGDGDAPPGGGRRVRFDLRDLGTVRPSGGAVDGIPPELPEDAPDDVADEDAAEGRGSGAGEGGRSR